MRSSLSAFFVLLALAAAPFEAAAAPSKLGDLGPYRVIAADVSALVDKGDFAAGKTRIADLEKLWDRNEPALKPKSPNDWHVLDKAIDEALHQLRRSDPVAADAQKALNKVLDLIDQTAGTP
jgi:hypothetical protein